MKAFDRKNITKVHSFCSVHTSEEAPTCSFEVGREVFVRVASFVTFEVSELEWELGQK
jgi:hypothetical protein